MVTPQQLNGPLLQGLLARAPTVTREDLVVALLSTPSVGVAASSDFEVSFTDLMGNEVDFIHLSITEVDIAAPQLAAGDSVRLRLFRRGQRLVPQDLVAEFDGASQISGTWIAAFSNRRIEYTDQTKRSKLYLTVRNTSGNTAASTFNLLFYARLFRP